MVQSMGIMHICDVASVSLDQADADVTGACNGIISIYDEPTLLNEVWNSQQHCLEDWYQQLVALATKGDPSVQFHDGVLCKIVGDTFCPVIPHNGTLVLVILRELHSSALGGHLGKAKLLKQVRRQFYWKDMAKDVAKFCEECIICQEHKQSTQAPIGNLQPLDAPSHAFEQVTMDFVTHLPQTARGFDVVFTVVDRFSKLVRFIPCKTTCNAEETACLFFDEWVCRFGMPQKIVSDHDPRFMSMFWTSLMHLLQCHVALSTAYHPQTDGQSERFHRTVEQILRCYVSLHQDDWDLCLPQCEFAMNSSTHATTAQIPFTVVFGIAPSLPLDHAIRSLQDNKVQSSSDVVAQRARVNEDVRSHITSAAEYASRYANKHHRDVEFDVGSHVWLWTSHLYLSPGLSRKLSAPWVGPYRISAKISLVAYRLELPACLACLHPIFHASLLKPHHGDVPACPAPVYSVEDAPEFEVEDILSHRILGRGRSSSD